MPEPWDSASHKKLGATIRTTIFELLIVFVGVWTALWAESRRDTADARGRAVQVFSAIAAEVSELDHWYSGWRDTVDTEYERWRKELAEGKQPPLFYFRIPGAEAGPTVGWQAALASDALQVFDPVLLFEIANSYHEFNGIGPRVARYMASTEKLVFPTSPPLGELTEGIVGRANRYTRGRAATGPGFYDQRTGELLPQFAAHLALMEEVLAELGNKMDRMRKMKEKIDSVLAQMD